mmetsp:Transcript_113016/g.326582  ORF Transcript_113016/g.326582 Transcript_113016/m.326582 type:complete len:322 (+) Transcript_113016:1953-2918(+)
MVQAEGLAEVRDAILGCGEEVLGLIDLGWVEHIQGVRNGVGHHHRLPCPQRREPNAEPAPEGKHPDNLGPLELGQLLHLHRCELEVRTRQDMPLRQLLVDAAPDLPDGGAMRCALAGDRQHGVLLRAAVHGRRSGRGPPTLAGTSSLGRAPDRRQHVAVGLQLGLQHLEHAEGAQPARRNPIPPNHLHGLPQRLPHSDRTPVRANDVHREVCDKVLVRRHVDQLTLPNNGYHGGLIAHRVHVMQDAVLDLLHGAQRAEASARGGIDGQRADDDEIDADIRVDIEELPIELDAVVGRGVRVDRRVQLRRVHHDEVVHVSPTN